MLITIVPSDSANEEPGKWDGGGVRGKKGEGLKKAPRTHKGTQRNLQMSRIVMYGCQF